MSARKFICLHGHFYQPPRENPWLEVVETQDTAAPFHDWNARVSAECYAPNSAARILAQGGVIQDIVNNYERISFNFGPTLLSWMESQAPQVYAAVLEADLASLKRWGHGNAMAQVYNHVIMPLATRRDKLTQVRWGIQDFLNRFGRKPEGMWLAEAAVDNESLAILAAEGIRFTVLSPGQCQAVRQMGRQEWQDVSGGRVDPRRAYRVRPADGLEIAVFFYDGPASRAVAFERLLDNGEFLAGRVLGLFDPVPSEPQLANLATDGESYGHHHRFGEMALAYALRLWDRDPNVELTNFATFLELHPPTWEAKVVENSSWSCAHGVERWRSDCGCGNSGLPGWNLAWRAPLRRGLNALKARLDKLYESQGKVLFKDPWVARDDYGRLIVDLSQAVRRDFILAHQAEPWTPAEETRAFTLLESQRYGQYMFTSCGWFFDDLAGLEPVQNLRYAARAMQLAEELDGGGWEEELLGHLALARSNQPLEGSGVDIWRRQVATVKVDARRVAAHTAISGVLGETPPPPRLYCYDLQTLAYSHRHNLGLHLCWGRLEVAHRRLGRPRQLAFAAMYSGGHDFQALVAPAQQVGDLTGLGQEVEPLLRTLEKMTLWRLLQERLGGEAYTLADLFLEGRRELALAMLERTMASFQETAHRLYDAHRDAMLFLHEINVPLPPVFTALAEVILDQELSQALGEEDGPLPAYVQDMAMQARSLGLALDRPGLRRTLEETLTHDLNRLCCGPTDQRLPVRVQQTLDLAQALKVEVDLWGAQNHFQQLLDRLGTEGLPEEMTLLGRRLRFDL